MNSEKRYKHTEDKIAAAADAADYAFNEASWQKMEALLDKNKDKRRPFFWIFSFLLLGTLIVGGGIIYKSVNKSNQPVNTAGLIIYKNNDKKQLQPSEATDDIMPVNQPALPKKITENENTTLTKAETNKDVDLSETKTNHSVAVIVKTDSNKDADLITGSNKKPGSANTYKTKITKQTAIINYNQKVTSNSESSRLKKGKTKTNAGADNYKAANKYIYKDRNKFAVKIIAPDQENDVQEKTDNLTTRNTDDFLAVIKADSTASDLTKNKAIIKPDTNFKKTNISIKKTDKKEKKKKVFSGVYVFGVAGAEVSSTKLLSYKNSTLAPRYGLGLGYRLNRRFSLQAGFYAGAKKYIAGPNDYNVKAGSYLSTVKIITVDANCLVYEIPFTLQYNWLTKPKANYYVALGVNSYLMKKEKYNYTFVRNNMQYSYPYEYTRNSHLFSSVQFSLGMEKKIARKLYLQAAPTFDLPLQGVGDGKIKLFTTSLQVGLKYLPFK